MKPIFKENIFITTICAISITLITIATPVGASIKTSTIKLIKSLGDKAVPSSTLVKPTMPNDSEINKPSISYLAINGTVSDYARGLNNLNYRGEYIEGEIYFEGEFVNHRNRLFMVCTSYNPTTKPGTSHEWKAVDANYHHPEFGSNIYSKYNAGDYVIYNNEYYVCLSETWTAADPEWHITNDRVWRKVDKPKGIYHTKNVYRHDSIVAKYAINIDLVNLSNVNKWQDDVIYTKGDIVKYRDFAYIKVFDDNKKTSPSTNDSGWTKLSIRYDKDSSYVKGDVVLLFDNNTHYWIRAVRDVISDTNPYDEIHRYNKNHHWEKVY